MATWTSLVYPLNSLLTSVKLALQQDNFLALAQGASGAPKILTAALNQVSSSEAVITAAIRANSITQAKVLDYAAGTGYVEADTLDQATDPSNTYSKVAEYYMPRGGTVTSRIWLTGSGVLETFFAKLYKNGSPVGTERTRTFAQGQTSWDENVSFVAGDLIQLYIKGSSAVAEGLAPWRLQLLCDANTSLKSHGASP